GGHDRRHPGLSRAPQSSTRSPADLDRPGIRFPDHHGHPKYDPRSEPAWRAEPCRHPVRRRSIVVCAVYAYSEIAEGKRRNRQPYTLASPIVERGLGRLQRLEAFERTGEGTDRTAGVLPGDRQRPGVGGAATSAADEPDDEPDGRDDEDERQD